MDQDQNQPQGQFPDQNRTESTPKQSVVARVQQAQNVLVTVRSNPNVDELAACIGLTLMLNKLGKHATAVFSGQVPSTLEFLRPEETIEQNTDSLRDFIVSLDKSKADKLRYKVEENVVKIFITPYRTSITQDDLEFTQGDFNVDVVVALGVTVREDLDQAITAHGRILHDATVVTVTAGQSESTLGQLNWQEMGASSLCEMLVSISEAFQGGIIDEQMATAFLTGIVAQTDRFSNTKTTPKVMTMAAQLMAAGANQQLIANELQKIEEVPLDTPVDLPHDQPGGGKVPENDDGSLTITHDQGEEKPQDHEEPKDADDHKPEQPLPEQADNKFESFLPPLPQSEAENSFEPLLSHDAHSHSGDEPKESFEPASHHDIPEGQIHIDDEGNLLSPGRPLQPKHNKIIEPAGPLEEVNDQTQMDQELADISSILQQSNPTDAEPPAIEDVKQTDVAEAFPESASVPEIDLPTLPPSPEFSEPQPAEPTVPDPSAWPMPAEQSQMDQPPLPPMPATPALTLPSLDMPAAAAPASVAPPEPVEADTTTLLDIEKTVNSPHLEGATGEHVDGARNAVEQAINQAGYDANRPQPRTDLNAQPFTAQPTQSAMIDPSAPDTTSEDSLTSQVPGGMPLHGLGEVVDEGGQHEGTLPPPPVPPPLMPLQ